MRLLPSFVKLICFALDGRPAGRHALNMLLRLLKAIALATLLLALAPSRADACSCMMGTPLCQSFWETDAVFAGEVLDVSPIPNPSGEQFMAHRRVRIRVSQAWRGGVAGVVEVTTGAGGGDCGYNFEKGVTYLVYAHARGGTLSTSICSRTRPIARASEDLEYLKSALRQSAAGRIFGVVRSQRHRNDPLGPGRPLSGYTVVLSSSDRVKKTASTDDNGRFEFADIPAGRYTVRLETPETEHAYGPRDVTLADPRGCAAADFTVVPDGRVVVRIVDPSGEPVSDVTIELLDVDTVQASSLPFPSATAISDSEGRADFSRLQPDNYILAINATRPPSVKEPYASNYFPGVAAGAEGRILQLGPGERVDLGEWTLPRRLVQHTITGQIVWPDGRPVERAVVTLRPSQEGPWRHRSVDKGYATTDAEGRFALAVHEGIRYQLSAHMNVGEPVVQWTAAAVEVTGAAPVGPFTLELQPPRRPPR